MSLWKYVPRLGFKIPYTEFFDVSSFVVYYFLLKKIDLINEENHFFKFLIFSEQVQEFCVTVKSQNQDGL